MLEMGNGGAERGSDLPEVTGQESEDVSPTSGALGPDLATELSDAVAHPTAVKALAFCFPFPFRSLASLWHISVF